MSAPWTCRLGLHDFIQCGIEEIKHEKRGPFDPRSDEARTFRIDMEICARCGKKREWTSKYDTVMY
jgi:hypothetical protein